VSCDLKDILNAVGPSASLTFASWIFLRTNSWKRPLKRECRAPTLRDQPVARWRGMHPVDRPPLGSPAARDFIEARLEGNPRGADSPGHARCRLATLVEGREPRVVHEAASQHERLHHQQSNLRQCALRREEDRGVFAFVVGERARVAAVVGVPVVVHTDEHAQH